MRSLKPGGSHVFTVPWYWWKDTLISAVRGKDATIEYIEKPHYHMNPIDAEGSLVVTEWGRDVCDFIYRVSGATTTAILIENVGLGIKAEFNEAFVSAKPTAVANAPAQDDRHGGFESGSWDAFTVVWPMVFRWLRGDGGSTSNVH